MSVSISQFLATQSALYSGVRAALSQLNESLAADGLRLNQWPSERAGCLYALLITLERGAHEVGECRFTIDWKGEIWFDADDQPLAPCAPARDAAHALLSAFIARRTQSREARNAA